MSQRHRDQADHDRWARLRFAVIGPLLAAPPEDGELQQALRTLSQRQWRHPVSGEPVQFGVSTIERWYYAARNAGSDPVEETVWLDAVSRELKVTAPYMHNGVFKTLDEVVEFYDRGGGGKGTDLKPLGLTADEKKGLVAFLLSLSGDPITVPEPPQPDLQVRANFGKN